VIKGAKTTLSKPTGVFVDAANGEVWASNFGNHTATVYARDASGDMAPKRTIRSAPAAETTPMISNPYSISYDPGREQIIVPSCVANPQIGIFDRQADKHPAPVRRIAGNNTKINRTIHGVSYDEIHDEIVVNSMIGQGVLVFRGAANGNEAPIRVIQGLKTQISLPAMVEVDPVNNEIYVPARGQLLVFNRTDQGDVAPKRILKTQVGRVAVDYVHNVIAVTRGAANRRGEIAIFDRTAEGDAKPIRVIGGPNAMMDWGSPGFGFDIHPPTGMIMVSIRVDEIQSDKAFVGIWNINDDGDVPPRWKVGTGTLRNPRGVAADAKNKAIIISDKYLNGVFTFSIPEMFEPQSPRNTAELNPGGSGI
jgi:DNA-binding beta-propeller fold protein YncE